MAKNFFVNVNGEARKVKTWYVNVNGEARKVKKAYANVNGEARLFWDGGGDDSKVIFHDGKFSYVPYGFSLDNIVVSRQAWNSNQNAYNLGDVKSSFLSDKTLYYDPYNSNSEMWTASRLLEQGATYTDNLFGFYIPVIRMKEVRGWRVINRDDNITVTHKFISVWFLLMSANPSNGLRRTAMEDLSPGSNWYVSKNQDYVNGTVDYVGLMTAKPTWAGSYGGSPKDSLAQIKTIEVIGGRAYRIGTHAASAYIEYAALTQYMMPRPEFDLTYLPNNTFFRFYASKTNGGAICTDESILVHVQPKENNQGLEIRFVSKTMFYLMQGTTREGQSTNWTTNNAVALTYNGLTYYSYFIRLDYLTYSYRETWYKVNDRANFTFGTLATDKLAWEIAYICFNGSIS